NVISMKYSLVITVQIMPQWTYTSTLNLAIPLTIVSLTEQFLTGIAILKLSGYDMPAKPILSLASIVSVGVAIVGGITIVLAAITAALCTGKDAHELKEKRYIAGIANGIFYILGGLFAG